MNAEPVRSESVAPESAEKDLYFEDFTVGRKFPVGSYTVTEDEMLEFSRQFDPQPMHVDKEAAEAGPFGGIIASGWHTASLAIKLAAEARPFGNTQMLGLGVSDLHWPQPVRPGDTLTVELEVEEARVSKSKPDFGIVKFRVTAYNQRGEVAYEKHPSCWVPRRKPLSETVQPAPEQGSDADPIQD